MIGRVGSLDVFLLERQALRSLEHVLAMLMAAAREGKAKGRPDARARRRRAPRTAQA